MARMRLARALAQRLGSERQALAGLEALAKSWSGGDWNGKSWSGVS